MARKIRDDREDRPRTVTTVPKLIARAFFFRDAVWRVIYTASPDAGAIVETAIQERRRRRHSIYQVRT